MSERRSEKDPMETPRPSVAEMKRLVASELSTGRRMLYTLLLCFDLAVGAVFAALLWTEPGVPVRTRVAFVGGLMIAAVWAVYFVSLLMRKKVMLARQQVVAGRIAVAFSGLFAAGCGVLAVAVPEVRGTALAAGACGVGMFAVAGWMLVRARRRFGELVERRRKLEHELAREGKGGVLLVALLTAGLLLAAGAPVAAQVLSPTPFEVTVPAAPVPVPALGRLHLVYEVHVTSFGEAPVRLVELAVTDGDGAVLDGWHSGELAARLVTVGGGRDPLALAPGRRTVAFLWLALPPGGEAPETLVHRLTVADEAGGPPVVLSAGRVEVGAPPAVLGGAPVGAGRWVALRGPSNGNGHRRSLVALDGAARVPQRHAVDWARLCDDGRLFRGDGAANEDWCSWGEAVRAAAAGTVVRVVDGLEDHPPGAEGAAMHESREEAPGNVVVIDQGDGVFAVYAHLRAGSVAVTEGDAVAAGDRLGEIGNSGHSRAPHLHFHLADDADPLAAEGLPFVLPGFRLIGRLDSFPAAVRGEPWAPDARRPAREVAGETLLENMVVELE